MSSSQLHLLHLDASANRTTESITRRLTALFARRWLAANGDSTEYRCRDLVADPVPPLDTAYCSLGRRLERDGLLPLDRVHTRIESDDEKRQWELTRPLIEDLRAADILLIGAPMYNYSISAALKTWIDRVSFPGALTDPESGRKVLAETRVVVVTASGGAYGPGTPRDGWDFQTPYLRSYFSEHGVREENLSFISAEMTLADLAPGLAPFRPLAARSRTAAEAAVRSLTETANQRGSHGEHADGTSAEIQPMRSSA